MVTRVMRMRTDIIMINTLSNMYCEISLVVKAPHRTHAIRTLTTRDISQYTSDNIIVSTIFSAGQVFTLKGSHTHNYC